MRAAIAVIEHSGDEVLAQPCVDIRQARIGSAVGFLHRGVWWAGRVVDVRQHLNNPDHDILSVACLGWPMMFSIERDRGAWVSEDNMQTVVEDPTP